MNTDSRSTFYLQTAQIIRKFLSKSGSIRSLCYHSTILHKKATFALVCQTLKHINIIKDILAQSDIEDRSELLIILVYDLLFGQGLPSFRCYDPTFRKTLKIVRKKKQKLLSMLDEIKTKNDVESIEELLPSSLRGNLFQSQHKIRYARINILLTTPIHVRKLLLSNNFTNISIEELINLVNTQNEENIPLCFAFDNYVAHLICFPGSILSKLLSTKLIHDNLVILQDKASCFPPMALFPDKDSTIIDACSAPGNKTHQMSCIMHNTGKIFAIERNKSRSIQMEERLRDLGVRNTHVSNSSFLDISPQDPNFSDVKYILLDPTCSSSGIPSIDSKLANYIQGTSKKSDLSSLTEFQFQALSHCFQFPSVQRIAYSTCSINIEENEKLIDRILPIAKKAGFHLIESLPNWKRRGINFPWANKCIRTNPEDYCIGFFLACFSKSRKKTKRKLNSPTYSAKIQKT